MYNECTYLAASSLLPSILHQLYRRLLPDAEFWSFLILLRTHHYNGHCSLSAEDYLTAVAHNNVRMASLRYDPGRPKSSF